MKYKVANLSLVLGLLLCASSENRTSAQQAPTAPSPRQLFDQTCVTCHGNPAVPRAADPSVLRRMTPERVYEALTTGVMRAQARDLDDAARRAIAEYLGDRKLGAGEVGDAKLMPNRCQAGRVMRNLATRAWNGWGVDRANTRFQPLSRVQACRLLNCRAFTSSGLSGSRAPRPSTVSRPSRRDRVFVGADTGYVYALDRPPAASTGRFRRRRVFVAPSPSDRLHSSARMPRTSVT